MYTLFLMAKSISVFDHNLCAPTPTPPSFVCIVRVQCQPIKRFLHAFLQKSFLKNVQNLFWLLLSSPCWFCLWRLCVCRPCLKLERNTHYTYCTKSENNCSLSLCRPKPKNDGSLSPLPPNCNTYVLLIIVEDGEAMKRISLVYSSLPTGFPSNSSPPPNIHFN